jgi:hypothetical protein
MDGKYTLLVYPTAALVASFIGFKSLEFKVLSTGVRSKHNNDDDANVLDDVVVTGVVNPESRLESSVSVSSIGTKSLSKQRQ